MTQLLRVSGATPISRAILGTGHSSSEERTIRTASSLNSGAYGRLVLGTADSFPRAVPLNGRVSTLPGQFHHPKYVQELLGHASITLTLDTYSHVLPGMDGGAASAMDEALG